MDDVLTELRLLSESRDRYDAAQRRYNEENTRQHNQIWNDLASLRDDLHAVANRVESLTRSVAVPFACAPDESGGVRGDAA